MTGRSDIHQGSRVIIGSGLGAGEIATVESVIGGVIPAALVRTDAGMARRVRTIDLTPVPPGAETKTPAAETASPAAETASPAAETASPAAPPSSEKPAS